MIETMDHKIPGWKYYNHAAIPTTAPHEHPDLAPVYDGSIWHVDGMKPLFVCYITNWDCGYETNWWYVIKDTPFDISILKTKRRYEITKALRFFDCREINPIEYADALAKVQKAAFSAYPAKYRPVFNKELFIKSLECMFKQMEMGALKFFGAFFKDSQELAGYCYINVEKNYLNFSVQKTNPKFEKYNVNAALVYCVLDSFKDKINEGCYICDGSRSINHETRFQDYLEKYFGFRKAYCNLKIVYSPLCRLIIIFLYPIRHLFNFLGRYIGFFHQISAVLRMEEILKSKV